MKPSDYGKGWGQDLILEGEIYSKGEMKIELFENMKSYLKLENKTIYMTFKI